MRFTNKGKPPKGGSYLECDRASCGLGCQRRAFRYDEAENAILKNCGSLRPESVLPDPDEKEREVEALRERIAGLVGELRDIDRRMANLDDQIETTDDREQRKKHEARILELRDQREEKEKARAQAAAELCKLSADRRSFTAWKRDLKALMTQLADVDIRFRLRAHLAELLEREDVFAHGFPEVYDEGELKKRREQASTVHVARRRGEKQSGAGALTAADRAEAEYRASVEDIREHILEVVQETAPEELGSKDLERFLDWVVDRRMSRAGRFLRVTFKTGKVVNLVPPGSIADGRQLDPEGGYSYAWPNLDKLWKQFRKQRSRGKG